MLAQLDQDSNLSWRFSRAGWNGCIDDVGRRVTSCCGNGESSLTSVWISRNLRRAWQKPRFLVKLRNLIQIPNHLNPPRRLQGIESQLQHNIQCTIYMGPRQSRHICLYQPTKMIKKWKSPNHQNWLVVSTPLKNISQNGNLPQVGMKIKNIWNQHLEKPPLQLRCADLSTARRGHLQDLCRVTAELFRHAAQQPLLAAETDGNARA